MVNDWILYKSDSEENAFPVQVTLEMMCNELQRWNDRFEPIRLTFAILKKNGFTNCETSKEDLEYGNEYWYLGKGNVIYNSDLLITLHPNHFSIRHNGVGVIGGMFYVHELQHALKLLKVDKEIVL